MPRPRPARLRLLALLWSVSAVSATYYPLYDYSGTTFFDGFDFYGAIDNTTWGNVSYVDFADAAAESLAYINANGNAILRVDNTTTVLNTPGVIEYRKSVRITSKAAFDVGTLFVVDAIHMPFGCSVWPSVWLNGILGPDEVWPVKGEVDLLEAINLMTENQMALHSYAGCMQPANVSQLGKTTITNCNDTTGSGCTVSETKANSYGTGFNNAGGGVFALQFDLAGVFMWFWSRPNIPKSITTTAAMTPQPQINLSDWGTPSASYPAASCNISQFFGAQQLIVDITLCGLWAGIQSIYDTQCPGTCFASNIAGNGSNYADAYFEIPSIRTWTVDPAVAANASASASSISIAQTTGTPSASGAGASATGQTDASGSTNDGVSEMRRVAWTAGMVGVGVILGVGLVL